MKKTLSQVYRLAFIVFYIWATVERAVLPHTGFFRAFSDFSLFADTLCAFVIAAAFICSIVGKIPSALIKLKGTCTALALLVLFSHVPILFAPTAEGWILQILLPLMTVLDWLLFDSKGSFRFYDPLLWLLAAILLPILWSVIQNGKWDLDGLLQLLGGKERLASTILSLLAGGGLMYGLDRLFSGKGIKPWNLFCLLYRLLYLFLMGRALYLLASGNAVQFFLTLKRFAPLSGFVGFLLMAVLLIFCVLHVRKFSAASPFPRVKGAVTLLAAVTIIGYHFFLKDTPRTFSDWILYYIGPGMMILDWLMFDAKRKCKPYDPVWWSALPTVYGMIFMIDRSLFSMYPAFAAYDTKLFICGGILLSLGIAYVIYLIDICFGHK